MNSIGLRFILKGGAFVDVVTSPANAGSIIHQFESRYYHVKGIEVIKGECQSGTSWCVCRDDIMAVHTVRLENQPKAITSLLSGKN